MFDYQNIEKFLCLQFVSNGPHSLITHHITQSSSENSVKWFLQKHNRLEDRKGWDVDQGGERYSVCDKEMANPDVTLILFLSLVLATSSGSGSGMWTMDIDHK